ncbi:MAG: heme exporter protein CcmD [Gammaproteobacteria bacterium]|nr:heme exporter protein CcmD [Gammaproteobacteria bacterium]
MDAFYEFLNMGGYAFYVWTSYATAAVVLIANLIAPMRLRRKLLLDLNRKARRELRNDAQA